MTVDRTSYVPFGRPLWSLREDVVVDVGVAGGPVASGGPWGLVQVPDDDVLVRTALDRMSLGPVSLENIPGLDESFRAWRSGTGTCWAWQRVRRVLTALGGRVVVSLGTPQDCRPLLSVVGERERVRFTLPVPAAGAVHLAPGTRLADRRRGPTLVRPGSQFRVQMLRRRTVELARVLTERPATVPELACHTGLPHPVVRDVVAYLAGGGLVDPPGPGNDSVPPCDRSPGQ